MGREWRERIFSADGATRCTIPAPDGRTMGNEPSKFEGVKYQVTDHSWPVGFRTIPRFDQLAYHVDESTGEEDTTAPKVLPYPEIVTLKPGSEVTGPDGIEYIRVLEEDYKDWGWLPLTSPVHGELLSLYDGKGKAEQFEDGAAFESIGKGEDFNDDYEALQKEAAEVGAVLAKMGMNNPNQVFTGASESKVIQNLQAYVIHRNREAKEIQAARRNTDLVAPKMMEHMDKQLPDAPEWLFARELYKSNMWATKNLRHVQGNTCTEHGSSTLLRPEQRLVESVYHSENGSTFAFEEDDVMASEESANMTNTEMFEHEFVARHVNAFITMQMPTGKVADVAQLLADGWVAEGDIEGVTTGITAAAAARVATNDPRYNSTGYFTRRKSDGKVWYYLKLPDRGMGTLGKFITRRLKGITTYQALYVAGNDNNDESWDVTALNKALTTTKAS